MARPTPVIENLPGAPNRSPEDWLRRLEAKAAIKANADSGPLYDTILNTLKTAYGLLLYLDVLDIPVDEPVVIWGGETVVWNSETVIWTH